MDMSSWTRSFMAYGMWTWDTALRLLHGLHSNVPFVRSATAIKPQLSHT